MFKIIATDGKARAGALHTAHGAIETPLFMPVATKAALKWVSLAECSAAEIECFIANAYLLSLQPGLAVIKKAGGLHGFMNWSKGIFTDSGGFQVLSEEFLLKINDNGVFFRNPFDKSRSFLSPEKCIEIQNALGSDVAMCLDDVPLHGSSAKRIAESAARTFQWAKRCKETHKSKKQLLFGICQGGTIEKLRRKSAEQISSIDFDGIALGGLCIGEPKQKMLRMVSLSNKIIPPEKPRYLMGVGSPKELLQCIALGIDVFDSCFPTRTARHGLAFTEKGNIDVCKSAFKFDFNPLDAKCACPVCTQHSRAYLHHLFKVKEENSKMLLSVHNLHFTANLVKQAREAIRERKFGQLVKRFKQL
jgi:queuine tRNA-ribosyltransferase